MDVDIKKTPKVKSEPVLYRHNLSFKLDNTLWELVWDLLNAESD
jgi:hypothetical protein